MKLTACIFFTAVLFPSAYTPAAQEKAAYLKQAELVEKGDTVQIVANSPRPLLQVLDALLQKYGWVVDYEDPQFTSAPDLRQSPDKQTLPAGGRFVVEFPARNPEEKILQSVLDAYNKSENPGKYELRKSADNHFAAVGTQARDAKGRLAHQESAFDTVITIPAENRSISATLDLICRAIAEKQKIPITLGVIPRHLADLTQVKAGGTKVPARDLLRQSLAVPNRQLYWQLLFDPGSKGYWLNVHAIAPAAKSRDSSSK
jgi:hypothetical protein